MNQMEDLYRSLMVLDKPKELLEKTPFPLVKITWARFNLSIVFRSQVSLLKTNILLKLT